MKVCDSKGFFSRSLTLNLTRVMTPKKNSIGVVVPTLNCVHLLPAHLDSMEPWLDLVDQIVVVDSHSDDGTWEMLHDRLSKHPGSSFHRRPRGLYQSWNYGISQLRTEFTYISTVGDSITRAGLAHLRDVAAEFNADVVISKPRFIEEDGQPSKAGPVWPVDDIIQKLLIEHPVVLDEWKRQLFQIVNPIDAILGSSASNIYRTRLLQVFPFPTDYGTVGDGAWSLANIFNYDMAVTPRQFSTFRRHAKSYKMSDYAAGDLNSRLFNLLETSLRNGWKGNPQAGRVRVEQMLETVRSRIHWQSKLEHVREMPIPWIFNPLAWRARRMRNRFREEALSQRDQMLCVIRPEEL